MTNTAKLLEKIDSKGLKKQYVAEYIGLKSRNGFMKKVNNESDFTSTEIKLLCKLLDITTLSEKEAIFFA